MLELLMAWLAWPGDAGYIYINDGLAGGCLLITWPDIGINDAQYI
jgi:hypothetical protein